MMQSLGDTCLNEHQFVTLLGRMRLYQCLPQGYQKAIPRMLLTDTQINSVAKAYINDDNFGSLGSDLSMWNTYERVFVTEYQQYKKIKVQKSGKGEKGYKSCFLRK